MNLNQVNLVGRLTKAPELKQTSSGQNVATFSIATNRAWTDKQGQKQEVADFHNVVVWGKLAELASKWLEKGQEALVQGRLQTRNYEDKNKVKHYVTEVIAENIQFGSKAQKTDNKIKVKTTTQHQETSEVAPEDLPF